MHDMVSKSVAQPQPWLTISRNLENTDRHPILIFGASEAGKTALIVSLLKGLMSSPEVDLDFGESVLDLADPRAAKMHESVKKFYDRVRIDGSIGVVRRTLGDAFFLPIDIKPKDSRLRPVKLALLEGEGEPYEPNVQDQQGDVFKPLNPDIAEIIESYSYGITMICAAPYSVGGGHERDTHVANFSLVNVLEAYKRLRSLRRHDFLLFLLTKWDQFVPPLDAEERFDQVNPALVNRILDERYCEAWGTFQGLPLEGKAHDRRAFMQYSSGYFLNGRLQAPPGGSRESFARYPRTILNWLYGNARRYKLRGENFDATIREVLFDEVIPGVPRVTVTEFLASLLTAR